MHRIFRKISLLSLLAVLFVISFGSAISVAQNTREQKPKLIVRVVVEQMRYEMLLRYWDKFDEDGGFKWLTNEGLICKNTQLSYAMTERAAGFATLSTGAVPASHGIIADYWYNRLSDDREFSIEHNSYYITDDDGITDSDGYSPHKLFTTTLGDELKMINERSKIYSISLNPVSAVFGNGKLSNGAFWFFDKSGGWVTSSYYMDSLPQWVKDFNQRNLQDVYMNRKWDKLLQEEEYINSMPDNNEAEKGFTVINKSSFPYNLSLIKDKSYSYKYLKYTPFGNTYTKDFALALLENEDLGGDEHTDLLSISLASSSYLDEIFGSRSREMEDLFYRLDKDLAHLLDYLETEIGKENILVVFTSDRGSLDLPAFRESKNLPAKTFKPRQSISLLNSYLNIIYEKESWVKSYYNSQLYLDHGLIDQNSHDIEKFQEQIARFLEKKSGVLYATRASSLRDSYYDKGIKGKVQRSYHPKRSGDIFLSFEPGSVEYPNNTGSAYNYDSHIPLIWYGMKLKPGVVNSRVSLKDITPTISLLFDLPLPEASNGDIIDEVIDAFED
ncbi:MAG: alkaline phosphatase family protein [Bacteroidales bacterium]